MTYHSHLSLFFYFRTRVYVVLIFSFVFQFFFKSHAYENINFIHTDHLGSTSIVSNEKGELIENDSYYPYGKTKQTQGIKQVERSYTGQISDQDQTGLYYYNSRYYNPAIAKFTQADVVSDGQNRYAYVGNNPINYKDPSGTTKKRGGGNSGRNANGGSASRGEGGTSTGAKVYLPFILNRPVPSFSQYKEYLDGEFAESLRIEWLDYVGGFSPAEVLPTIDIRKIKEWSETDIGLHTPEVINELSYNCYSGVILINDLTSINDFMSSFFESDLMRGAIGDKLSYGTVFLHEARHIWQLENDINGEFVTEVYKLAKELDLLNNDPFDYVYDDIGYDPGLSYFLYYSEEKENTYIRPHFIWYEDGSDLYGISYRNVMEVDAIMAEVMMDSEGRRIIKNQYPQMWNLMLSQPGYFNPKYFQPVKE